jgi:glycerol-3-phosphate acyltransferase PlsY
MNLYNIILNIIFIVLGYLIGSVNPGYILGRLKRVDIRKIGSCNAGTKNVYHSLGVVYAVPTAIYDTLKGLFAMLIVYLLGADYYIIHICGLMAIVGHIFPFYLRFNGGQGVATATGIMLIYLLNYLINAQWLSFLAFIVFCLCLVAIFKYVTREDEFLSIILLPLLGFYVYLEYPGDPYNIFLWIILAHICIVGLYNIMNQKLITIEDEEFKRHWWRLASRPFAVFFILFHYYFEQLVSLTIVGIVALCFIIMDLIKIVSKSTQKVLTKRVKSIFRKGEEDRFSSMTAFLVSSFIIMLIFEKEIAIAALTFTIFGDIFSKIFGLGFGRHKIFDKTIEGSLAYFGCVLICWFVLTNTLDISTYIILIGAISAPLTEIISIRINDNFTVPIISGVVMEVGRVFGL